MEIIENSFTLLLILSAAATAVAAIMATQRWHATSAPAVVVLMLVATWWSLSYALEIQNAAPSSRFWLTAVFIGVVFMPPSFLAFALVFTDRGHLLNRRGLALLAIQPLVVLPVLLTDANHHLFFAELNSGRAQPLDGGPVFWLNALYSFVLVLWAIILLAGAYRRAPALKRKQLGFLLAGAITPTGLNILSLALLTPTVGLDATPLGFTLTGVAMIYNLRHIGLLDLIPVARYEVVNRMSDGVLVLDPDARLIDINPAATRLLSFRGTSITGKCIRDTLVETVLADRLMELEPGSDTQLRTGDGRNVLDVRVTKVQTERTSEPGRLVVLRDITELRRAEEALRQQLAENEALQEQLRQEAIRDPLTGLFNRRFLEETLSRELARTERGGHELSVAILDIDHFKRFNDRFGHEHGDLVLRQLSDLLQSSVRVGDVACRYGGEEFVVVFPDATPDVALQRMDEIREAFAALPLRAGNEKVQATFSAGVAAFPKDGHTAADLMRAADRALYAAKGAGRNRIMATVASHVVPG